MRCCTTLCLVLTSTVRTCHPARELPLKIEGAGGSFWMGSRGSFSLVGLGNAQGLVFDLGGKDGRSRPDFSAVEFVGKSVRYRTFPMLLTLPSESTQLIATLSIKACVLLLSLFTLTNALFSAIIREIGTRCFGYEFCYF